MVKKLQKVCLISLCIFMLAGCGKKGNPDSIRIGASGPLTGGAADYGINVKNGAELAIEEINEKEGKEYFDFAMEDDLAEGEKAKSAYSSLKDWNMQISLYTVTSGAGLAVAKDYYNDRIFALTPSGSNPGVVYDGTTNYDNCFQVCFSDPNQGIASADYVASNGLASKVGVIYRNDDDYSKSIFNTFKEEAKKVGLEIVSETSFKNGDVDFKTQLLDAQKNGAELIFLPIYYEPAAIILTQANDMGYDPVFFGVDGMDGILALDGFDAKLAEGVYLLTPFAADAKDDATVHFVNAYKAKYGAIPTQFAADAYDAVYALYKGCQEGGVSPTTPNDETADILIKQFLSMKFEGLTGTATWSANGEVSKTPKAVIIENGVYVAAE